jgi:hypothetical protein
VTQDAVPAHLPHLREAELAGQAQRFLEAQCVRAKPGLLEERRVDCHPEHRLRATRGTVNA